tara:strand:+ start:286 stop:720 length:435 start_codon:yes stop_codon:yes gene_type:complete
MNTDFTFERVFPTNSQVKILYELLLNRSYSISNESHPTYKHHKEFVFRHPYRQWYLIYDKKICIGSVYIHYDNSIGINLVKEITTHILNQILEFVRNTVRPLKPVPSVRYKDFFLNSPAKNKNLQLSLEELGYVPNQISFVLKK